LKTPISKLRIGIPRTYFFDDLDPEVAAAVENAISHMRGKVAQTKDVVLPQFQFVPNGGTDIELYHYQRPYFEQSPEQYHPSSRRLLERAKGISAERYVETLKRIREARRDIQKTFEEVDVLLLPTMREPAPLVQEVVERKHHSRPSNVSAFNRFGLPAITVPCGFSKNNLPIGLQIAGPSFREGLLLSVAYAYQQSTEWHLRRP
jgi:aspartyl-tRNA(Asn)/glutamyl-tRNA(Gln) amidotransferase subunit A